MRGVCGRALKLRSVGEGCVMNKPMITGCQPDSGNPTVRDERGACGNVTVMGVGLRATGKPVERPPNPKMVRAPYFYPTSYQFGRRRSGRCVTDECRPSPRGLRQHRVIQRQVSNQASDDPGSWAIPKSVRPSMSINVKTDAQKAASRVMGIGEPQWLAKKRGNAR